MLLANVALPLPSFMGHWCVFAFLLPLVVAIEAFVLARVLQLARDESLGTSLSANVRSTLVGLPLGWLMALAGLIPAGIVVSFLPPGYGDPAAQVIRFAESTGGGIPPRSDVLAAAVANLLMLIPYYFATVYIERKAVQARHPTIDPKRVALAVRWMNRITYSVLALLLLGYLVAAIVFYHDGTNDEVGPIAEPGVFVWATPPTPSGRSP